MEENGCRCSLTHRCPVFESGRMMEVCFDKNKLSTKTFIHTLEVFVSVYIPTSNTDIVL